MTVFLKATRLVWAICLVGSIFWLSQHPAWALSASVSATSYSGPCPGNAAFSGTLSGANGSVTYQFFYYDPGSGQVITLPPHTANVNGSAAVADTGKVSGSGSAWVQLTTTLPGRVYSNKANFTVTCSAPPTPPPSPSPPPPGSNIPAPTGVTSTNDAGTCEQHGDAVACGFGIQQGDLVLIFAWFGASPIDGYRAYRVDGGQHTLVYHHNAGAQKTIAFIDKPSDGFNGKCYAITAYKGSAESAPSAPFCVGGSTPVGIQNTTLVSGHVKWLGASNGGNTGSAAGQVIKVFANLPYPGEGLPETGNLRGLACDRAGDTMCVGFVYNTTKHWYGDDFSNAWIRSAVWFDIGSLHAKQIWSAKLTLNIADAEAGGDTHSVPNLNCISKVEAASSAWWNGASWLDSNASRAATGINQTGSQVTIDVTGLAHLWLAGTPNDGLVLIGPSEDPNAFTENSCLSGYNSAVLTVQFTS